MSEKKIIEGNKIVTGTLHGEPVKILIDAYGNMIFLKKEYWYTLTSTTINSKHYDSRI